MDDFKESTIFYSLSFEDIQAVAMDELDRELSKEEMLQLVDEISESIAWYDVISMAIQNNIKE